MRFFFLFSLLAILGCHRENALPGPGTVEAGASNVEPEAPTPDMTQVLAQLTLAVRKFAAEQRRAPKSLDELVAQGDLSRVPEAPPGKRFAISKDLQVYLTSR